MVFLGFIGLFPPQFGARAHCGCRVREMQTHIQLQKSLDSHCPDLSKQQPTTQNGSPTGDSRQSKAEDDGLPTPPPTPREHEEIYMRHAYEPGHPYARHYADSDSDSASSYAGRGVDTSAGHRGRQQGTTRRRCTTLPARPASHSTRGVPQSTSNATGQQQQQQ